jgi:FkbM family methyltransferase
MKLNRLTFKFINRMQLFCGRVAFSYWNYDIISKNKVFTRSNRVRLGDVNASWVVPKEVLTKEACCYLVGAGENITFDFDLASKYKCNVHIFDPTPKAKDHYVNFCETIKKLGDDDLDKEHQDLHNLNFHEFGVWKEDTTIRFYSPKNLDHVSHSIVNLQGTEDFFLAKVFTIKTIMDSLNHKELILLKIDIEGAEYEVIRSFVGMGIYPRVFCVEFDEVFNPQDWQYMNRIKEIIDLLFDNGYSLFHLDFPGNYTFVK